ncbi:bifunctional DNA-formamidopyrimidine glycosylase/DNA-(apurinic or apyrimidinic site) lyase [Skermania piniformis]|uniref:Formamidopyrimidine-DNA glycosylase n=1 Tax=Skermania pinensis TaxID=39122 RepID=A0ABX8S4N8_9ACTN|nr:bifunctional DNA-formamidopyrimidine glycosylase/DNA-(apurinic or apyrimidinic site) lyase [Skermania piniformis]QXQ12718.1 bifunctional DNA-formamidopyrimidine glycosylase/DNA-(apurinic or apyrimidinic site) lyase [Skermania piniformis]
MPELPEVETVRRGLQAHLVDRTITRVRVSHPRSVRRHEPGAADLAARLAGRRVASVQRRGKFLWLTFADETDSALVVHLGMSGQMLVQPAARPMERHAHIVADLDSGDQLRFVDQRTFGGWSYTDLVEVDGSVVPTTVSHIARDPIDPRFDPTATVDALRAKRTEVKRALLDQTVVSGIGNIYADEALWRAKLHGMRRADVQTRPRLRAVLEAVRAVLDDALAAGGTSFDSLYVNVNGESGYFDRSLAVYGRTEQPCPRCGAPIRRERFMNRSSHSCPRCQPRPAR